MIEYTYDITTSHICNPTVVVASSPLVAVAKLIAKRRPKQDEGRQSNLRLVYVNKRSLEFTVQSEGSGILYFLNRSELPVMQKRRTY